MIITCTWNSVHECDNIKECHAPKIIQEDQYAIRVLCDICKHQYVIRKDWRGAPENRQYSKIYKRDILQGKENLFYKYNEQWLKK